jgi:hypothetical protein
MLDDLGRLNQLKLDETGDPEIATRIAQYELAYRMQTSVPELTDISREPKHILELYGPNARKPIVCWPAVWRSVACVSSSSSIVVGTSTPTCRSRSPASAATPTRRPPLSSRT